MIPIRLDAAASRSRVEALSDLLIDTVASGASVGFLSPLSRDEARAYWSGVVDDVQIGATCLFAILEGEAVIGTVQLQLAQKANAAHRAEIAKLMVHSRQRRRGLGVALMQAAHAEAARLDRSLIVLDTRTGDPSEALYRRCGYVEAGAIPGYARSSDGSLGGTTLFYRQS